MLVIWLFKEVIFLDERYIVECPPKVVLFSLSRGLTYIFTALKINGNYELF